MKPQEKKGKKIEEKEKKAPIIDGDARPDMLDEDRVRANMRNPDSDGDLTSNRAADVDKADDYRDS